MGILSTFSPEFAKVLFTEGKISAGNSTIFFKTVPNFIRSSIVPMSIAFGFMRKSIGMINSALIIGIFSIIIALFAIYKLEETYGKDLNYIEEV
jgi:hypothetical protein